MRSNVCFGSNVFTSFGCRSLSYSLFTKQSWGSYSTNKARWHLHSAPIFKSFYDVPRTKHFQLHKLSKYCNLDYNFWSVSSDERMLIMECTYTNNKFYCNVQRIIFRGIYYSQLQMNWDRKLRHEGLFRMINNGKCKLAVQAYWKY